jgi:hypothetical protein
LEDEDEFMGLTGWSGLEDDDDAIMLQTEDDVPEYLQESEDEMADGEQMPYTMLA